MGKKKEKKWETTKGYNKRSRQDSNQNVKKREKGSAIKKPNGGTPPRHQEKTKRRNPNLDG